MKIKIAVFNDNNPLKDYIYKREISENETPENVITEINQSLAGWHCELISIEKKN